MPEKDAELSTLEATESASPDQDQADAGESPAAEVRSQDAPVSRGEIDQLQAEYEHVKKERDGLIDRLARLQAEFENARKRAEREKAEFRDYYHSRRRPPLRASYRPAEV